MEGFQDEGEFAVEDVEKIIREAIKGALHDDASYNPKKVNEWTNLIVASCLKSLQELSELNSSTFISWY